MIFIVIDNAQIAATKVLGVYREHSQAEEFILSMPEDELFTIDVITWDIVNNQEVQ